MEYRITISPDPTRIVNKAQKRSYIACTSHEQYLIIKKGIREAISLTQQEYNITISIYVYFEFNSNAMLHSHGVVTFDTDDESVAPFFQRMIFRELGRIFIKGNPKTVIKACCDITNEEWKQEWINSVTHDVERSEYSSWLQYCLKDQTEKHLKRFPKYEISSEGLDLRTLD